MPVKQELFEAVRAVLAGRLRDESQVSDLAMRVAEESTVLRRRIERAVEYARKGLRLEACAEAEAEPSVFELAVAFDAEEMRLWRSHCSKNRLPVPDRIPAQAIGEIEEAIALTAPLRTRLARMRRQVLADAPAFDRLETLRELISRDPGNPAWQDDRAALEPVAAQELGDRCEAALRGGALEDADECVIRLEDGKWHWSGVSRVAATLRQQLSAAQAARMVEAAQRCLLRLEAERAAENELGARAEEESMRGLEARIADLGAELPDQVQERLSAIRLWLAGREGDAAARAADRERIAELERALADDLATESSLRSALGSAEQAAEGVPETLRASVERRLRDFGRVRHRRRLLRACVVLLAVGIASTAALMLARSSANESRIDSACEAVLGAIESGQLGEARRLLNELEADAAIAMDPKVASARDQLVAKEAQRQNRRRDVQKLIELAGPADAASSRRELVEQAKARAVDADQARQASSWLESHERAVRLERDKGLAAGRRRLAELRARVTSHTLESGSRSDEMLNAWEVELNDIARNVTGLDELQAEITVIRETLQAKRDQLRSAREQEDCAERLDGIGRFASSPTSLKAALDEFQRRCPLDPQARSLSDAGRLGLPAWEAVAAWSSIEPRPSDALAIRPQRERDAVAKALGVYLKDHGQTPFLGECDAVNSLLRDAPGWSAWLEGKLGELGAFEWWCIELGGGVRWYCLSDPRRESSRNQGSKVIKTVKVLRGESMEETLMDFDKSKIVFEGPSPQRELAVRLRSLLEDCRRSSNDVKGALDALAAVRSAERVDGKFATELVRGILIEFASQAPQVLHGDLSGAIEALERVRLDGIDWIRPDEESSRQRSQEAWIELRKAVRPDEWMRKYVEALSAAARPFGRRYEPAGAIVGSPEGRQRFLPAPGWPGDASGEVYAVVPGIGDTRARLVVVGTARDGAVDLAPAAVVPAGSMLFRLSREQGP